MSLHVKLPAASYWQLYALNKDCTLEELQAAIRIRALRERYVTLLHQLADAHGFDPTVNYQWDHTQCALIAPSEPAA